MGLKRSDHLTPILKDLHWLPVKKRIEFNILLITYKTIHGQSADYLKPLIEMYQPSRTLRSASGSLLCPQKAKTENYGCRAFVLLTLAWTFINLAIDKPVGFMWRFSQPQTRCYGNGPLFFWRGRGGWEIFFCKHFFFLFFNILDVSANISFSIVIFLQTIFFPYFFTVLFICAKY